jgi:transmembrane sensor
MPTFPNLRVLVVAAAVVMLSGSQLVGDTAGARYVSTAVGEQRPIQLDDDSVILLNTDTLITTQTDGPVLHVTVLRGEVLFSMRPDPHRNLVVSVEDFTVLDTATVFAVQMLENGKVRVTVEEGEVELSSADLGRLPLQHNQQAVADNTANRVVLRKEVPSSAIERQLAWREGRLVFGGENLSEVAHEFNRYNLTKLTVDPSIADVQVGGEFSPTDVLGFVRLMPRLEPQIRWERVRDAHGTDVLRLYHAPADST